MKQGDMFEFYGLYTSSPLCDQTGLYLGKDYIYRSDGVTVRNHKVLMMGKAAATIIDDRLLRFMRKV